MVDDARVGIQQEIPQDTHRRDGKDGGEIEKPHRKFSDRFALRDQKRHDHGDHDEKGRFHGDEQQRMQDAAPEVRSDFPRADQPEDQFIVAQSVPFHRGSIVPLRKADHDAHDQGDQPEHEEHEHERRDKQVWDHSPGRETMDRSGFARLFHHVPHSSSSSTHALKSATAVSSASFGE